MVTCAAQERAQRRLKLDCFIEAETRQHTSLGLNATNPFPNIRHFREYLILDRPAPSGSLLTCHTHHLLPLSFLGNNIDDQSRQSKSLKNDAQVFAVVGNVNGSKIEDGWRAGLFRPKETFFFR